MNASTYKYKSLTSVDNFEDVEQTESEFNNTGKIKSQLKHESSKFFFIDNSKIHYTDTGEGEAVLFIHCSTANSRQWQQYAQPHFYRCLATDQWGCGRSDNWAGRGEFSLLEEARPILKFVDELDEPVHLVGHSYGGSVALKVAMRRPDAVKKITLIEPSSFHLLKDTAHGQAGLFTEIKQLADNIEYAVRSGNYWLGMASFTNYWNGAAAWDKLPFEARLKSSQRVAKVLLDFHALLNEPTPLRAYKNLAHPVQLIYGDRSPAPSQKIVNLLGGTLANAHKVCVAGAGHMSPLTHANVVRKAVFRHLRN